MTASLSPQKRSFLQPLLASWRTGVLPCVTTVLLLALLPSGWAQSGPLADPPGSVARLNLMDGNVSFLPAELAGSTDANAWTQAIANRPLTTGDRLWAGPGARTELHVGSTTLRMNEQTSLDFLTLDDNVTRLRLEQGTLRLRVRTLFVGQRLQINTPNLAFVINKPGDYRIDANPASDTTRVVSQSGGGTIYGDSGIPLTLGNQQQGSFAGTDLAPAAPGASLQDSFDAWAIARDQREEQSVSARYIPREIVGYQQLDSYGDWSQDPGYGAVWLPRAMPLNWAPYRAGHWSWISPWGWTWIDDAPWGFAPFHYGRWAQIGPRWAWVPGRPGPRPVYAPALVAFVGGSIGGASWNISLGAGRPPQPGLGWFPLAPGEAFRPAYQASPRYVTQVNNSIVVNNVVNNANVYRYQRQPSAVTVVNAADFARGRLGRDSFQAVNASDLGRAPVATSHTTGPVALPPRPQRRDLPALAAAAAVPPAALLAPWPVVASGGERRDVQPATRREDRSDSQNDGRREDRGNDKRGRMESNLEPQRPAPALAPAPQGANAAAVAAMPVPSRAARPAQGPAPVAAGTPALPATPPLARPFQAQQGQQTPQTAQPNQNHRGPAAKSEQPRPYLNASRPPEALRDQPQRPVPQARVNAPAPVVIQAPNSQAAAEQARAAARSQEQTQQRAQRDQQQQEQGRQPQSDERGQQRQASEQQRQQQELHTQHAQSTEAARARGPHPEGASRRNREP